MITNTGEQEYALFSKECEYIKARLGNEQWITAYLFSDDTRQTMVWYCGLVKNSDVAKVLNNKSWELTVGQGFPGGCQRGFSKDAVIEYDRFGFSDAEPFLCQRLYRIYR